MRISLAHNLKESSNEAEAEFDSIETIDFIKEQIRSLGHEVTGLEARDVSNGNPEKFIKQIRQQKPDLIFNIAEGSVKGTGREGFFPALYEVMGIPYTGSSSSVLSLTSNKFLTNDLLKGRINVPWSIHIDRYTADLTDKIKDNEWKSPLIVKPNDEGSSKGIDQNSIVDSFGALERIVARQLELYNELLIEEYIDGLDVSVAWIDGIHSNGDDTLPPASYHYSPTGKYKIYDVSLKRTNQNLVEAKVPAAITPHCMRMASLMMKDVISILNIEGFCRGDFRVKGNGSIYFLEVNALPSLAPGGDAEMYKGMELMGKKTNDVFGAIIKSAVKKYKL